VQGFDFSTPERDQFILFFHPQLLPDDIRWADCIASESEGM
jgi:hypothetical protein